MPTCIKWHHPDVSVTGVRQKNQVIPADKGIYLTSMFVFSSVLHKNMTYARVYLHRLLLNACQAVPAISGGTNYNLPFLLK